MKQIKIQKNEAGQRLDKLLKKYLNQAAPSFIYKMLRKKNIKLNGKKASGNEILMVGDLLEIYLSNETFAKFSSVKLDEAEKDAVFGSGGELLKVPPLKKEEILYEDEHILLINKPQGVLSQKAVKTDISLNEAFLSYLLKTGEISEKELQTFHPSICNRLDRNTSGILIAGKSLAGLQQMGKLLQTRDLHKYYWCVVKGEILEDQSIDGYLYKDEKTNTVTIHKEKIKDSKPILTKYHPIAAGNGFTLLEVLLVTGRTHQIRAHLSSIAHPIIGDRKYGDIKSNDTVWKTHHIKDQLLHARRIEFPVLDGALTELSGKSFTAPLPAVFQNYVEEVITCPHGIPED